MVGKAPIYMLTGRKAPETQQICYYRHATKIRWPFLRCTGDSKITILFLFLLIRLEFTSWWFCETFTPRNYRLKKNGNLANFLSYVCKCKNIKELFASTLNEIAVSVCYVSSTPVVLRVELTDQLRRTQINEKMKCEENWRLWHENPAAMNARTKSTHFTSYPVAKH